MPRGSEELTNARKAEIVNACAVLYETRSFKEITLKDCKTGIIGGLFDSVLRVFAPLM